jgi:mannose-1-phosphate guanylyltransferase/mannose-6-phosphate isomerase
MARNTAAAVAVAALFALKRDPDAVLVVMPSDHVVGDTQGFVEGIKRAAAIAAAGRLVLFGIKPAEAHTGYGYIRKGRPLDADSGGFAVEAFCEKPERAVAEKYLAAGDYFWNSGIFVLSAHTYVEELQRLDPSILEAAQGALENATEDLGFLRLEATAFASSPNISIDYAVMEKTKAAAMLPLDVGWSDVGSWTSLWQIAPHDDGGNAVEGDAILVDTKDCLVHSERSLVATIGLEDLIIVDTPDALLVCHRDRAEEIKPVLDEISRTAGDRYL